MKKLMILSTILFIAISFKSYCGEPDESRYPKEFSSVWKDFLNKDYLKSMDNECLKQDIQMKFSSLFDNVSRVDANYSDSQGYYYVVLGVKEGLVKMEMLKIEKSDIDNQIYSYIDSSDLTSATEYCKIANGIPPQACPPICYKYTNPMECIGMICGVAPDCPERP